MSMFNWQASAGTNVLSSRFWVYWAVTVPLTLIVLAVWYFWLRQHRSHDLAPFPHQLKRKHTVSDSVGNYNANRLQARFRFGKLRIEKHTTPAQDTEAASSAVESESNAERIGQSRVHSPPRRTDTLVQGPMR